jgi:hypothetical protein
LSRHRDSIVQTEDVAEGITSFLEERDGHWRYADVQTTRQTGPVARRRG